MLFHHFSLLQAGAVLDLPTQASEYHYRAYASSFVHQNCKEPKDEGDRMKPDDNDFHLGGKNGNEAVGARQGSGKGAKGGERRDEIVAEIVRSQEGGGVIGAHGDDEDENKMVDETADQEIDDNMNSDVPGWASSPEPAKPSPFKPKPGPTWMRA
jgi:hypothetical protein